MSNRRKIKGVEPPKKSKLAPIPRCKPCNVGGHTNTKVVSVATIKTLLVKPGVEEGDFLCSLHDHPTAHRWKQKEGK